MYFPVCHSSNGVADYLVALWFIYNIKPAQKGLALALYPTSNSQKAICCRTDPHYSTFHLPPDRMQSKCHDALPHKNTKCTDSAWSEPCVIKPTSTTCVLLNFLQWDVPPCGSKNSFSSAVSPARCGLDARLGPCTLRGVLRSHTSPPHYRPAAPRTRSRCVFLRISTQKNSPLFYCPRSDLKH